MQIRGHQPQITALASAEQPRDRDQIEMMTITTINNDNITNVLHPNVHHYN